MPEKSPSPTPMNLLLIPFLLATIFAKDQEIDYAGFKLEFRCQARSADRWEYSLIGPEGDATRPSRFYLDPNLAPECQQYSVNSYQAVRPGFDRGHLVTSGHMDQTQALRIRSHYMSNIVPQVKSFNEGIWAEAERITSCKRERGIQVYGGVVYTDPSNDYFLESHGIATPDFMWKVLITAQVPQQVISWYIPNQEGLGDLDQYLLSVQDIESKLNDELGPIPIPQALKGIKATQNWAC